MEKRLYADVVVDISSDRLDHTFQYAVPKALQSVVTEGCKVLVPFGNGKKLRSGFVLKLSDTPKVEETKIRDIAEYQERAVNVEERLVSLAAWMRQTYGSTMNQALKTVLPVKEKKDARVRKYIVRLAGAEDIRRYSEEKVRKNAAAKKRFLSALEKFERISWTQLTSDLKISCSVIREFEEAGLCRVAEEVLYRTAIPEIETIPWTGESALTGEQEDVIRSIYSHWKESSSPVLIQGVTGSGKTHVYLRLIERMISEGRQVILLIPEIALTWQTVSRFYARFGERVAVMNSRLSPGERSDLYERVKNGDVTLVIGPRSALFIPFDRLGLIIIDEEHESSYRSETSPRYDARETAAERARIEGARLVLGSATPSVASRYLCEKGEYLLCRMHSRYGSKGLAQTLVVDMREELKSGNRTIISSVLEEEIRGCLDRNEQIMLFLNRRGHTGHFACRSCGKVIKCPHCDVSLTMHDNGILMCHYCGYAREMYTRCPECGSSFIGGFRVGTQQVAEVIKKKFPNARLLRMDRDTTTGKNSYDRILKRFAGREADILIGTQMIIKGHDFPDVTLMGILAADSSLFDGDYRSAENTFQLIAQACGRAGRGKRGGKAVIQTYDPENFAIRAGIAQDPDLFYAEEIENRALMGYPPVKAMLTVHAGCENEELLNTAAEYIAKYIRRIDTEKETDILGPVPESVSKIQDVYRSAVYVKTGEAKKAIRLRRQIEKYIEINKGFENISISFELER